MGTPDPRPAPTEPVTVTQPPPTEPVAVVPPEPPAGPDAGDPTVPPRTRRRWRSGARLRILSWYVVLLVVAAVASLLLQRRFLLDELDRDVVSALEQEVDEVRRLATDGLDPETGQPFEDDVAALFDTFLSRNIPSSPEVLLTFVGGQPYQARGNRSALDTTDLTARWGLISESESGEIDTPAGPMDYLAVPLQFEGKTFGVFVVGYFAQPERAEIDETLRTGAIVWATVLAVATIGAWFVAGRVLRPVRLVTEAAQDLTASDLTRRIPVEGDDEIAALARTFNGMLDRLERSFTSQRRFLDDAGHDLRTPITIIRGHLELLGDDPDERVETLALVTDELDRMRRIVDDLLVLARSEQPDFLRRTQVDLDLLTRDLLAKAEALGDRTWRLDATGHGVVLADGQRLTQAVLNLLDNAVRNTEPGAEVAIGSALDGDEVRLWVRDTGPGIPHEQQARIFERFARSDGGRRRAGTAGLGLAIARSVAEAHGGRIEVDSEPGHGALFTIAIPSGVEP